jgi:hypothetical protein
MLAAKLHAIATMVSLLEMQFNIFMISSLQSIHTEFAKLYSKKVISHMACPANLWERSSMHSARRPLSMLTLSAATRPTGQPV